MLSVVSVFGLRRSCFKQNKTQTLFIKAYTKFVCLVPEHSFVRKRVNNAGWNGDTVNSEKNPNKLENGDSKTQN